MTLSYILAKFTFTRRVLCIGALALVPVFAVGAILYVNYARRDNAFDTGYGTDVAALSTQQIRANGHYLFYSVERGEPKPGLPKPGLMGLIHEAGLIKALEDHALKLGLFVRSLWIPVPPRSCSCCGIAVREAGRCAGR